MIRRTLLLLALLVATMPCHAQTMQQLREQPPRGAYSVFQLTDGTVLAQGGGVIGWWKLTPDISGSYAKGHWKRVASLPDHYGPQSFAAGVLADGRVVISGGEYEFGKLIFTKKSAIYDPVADAWTMIPAPPKWHFIGDSPSVVLADGRFVIGEKFNKRLAALDPKTLTWTELPSRGKNDTNAEEGWTLMPDGSFLTFDVLTHPQSERYIPSEGRWAEAGSTVVDLRGPQNCCGDCVPYGKDKCYDPPGEVGPAILLPNGKVFAAGSIPDGDTKAHTSVYTPPSAGDKRGHWTPGPDFPNGDQAFDTFATLLPNGNVLIEGYDGQLYEYDGTKLIQEPFNGAGGFLMLLPTGEVLVGGSSVYQSTGTYNPAWAPTITACPSDVTRGSTYQIAGTQFNGLSQANAYGDENNTQTNYPLVRITNNASGHVAYARTHDHSTMGVATGSAIVSTSFDVSSKTELGPSSLVVVANGIPSAPVAVTVN